MLTAVSTLLTRESVRITYADAKGCLLSTQAENDRKRLESEARIAAARKVQQEAAARSVLMSLPALPRA